MPVVVYQNSTLAPQAGFDPLNFQSTKKPSKSEFLYEPEILTKKSVLESIKKTTKKKVSKTAEIIYPVLLECAQLCKNTGDEFWAQFYKDLSTGKGTRGIFISNGTLQTSNKRNGFTYSISGKTPEIIVIELNNLLTSRTSVCSTKDINKRKKILEEIQEEFDTYDEGKWTSIKRKNIRQMLILQFVLDLKERHGLTWKSTENALQVINEAFESKTHTSKDVEYEEGVIQNIIDLEIEDGTLINVRECIDKDVIEPVSKAKELQKYFESYSTSLDKAINLDSK
jgi:hypothetical protein